MDHVYSMESDLNQGDWRKVGKKLKRTHRDIQKSSDSDTESDASACTITQGRVMSRSRPSWSPLPPSTELGQCFWLAWGTLRHIPWKQALHLTINHRYLSSTSEDSGCQVCGLPNVHDPTGGGAEGDPKGHPPLYGPTGDRSQSLEPQAYPHLHDPVTEEKQRTQIPTNSFLFKLKRVRQWEKIWEISHLLRVNVTTNPFDSGGVPQCYHYSGSSQGEGAQEMERILNLTSKKRKSCDTSVSDFTVADRNLSFYWMQFKIVMSSFLI